MAGRINAHAGEIEADVADWRAYLTAAGKKAASIRAFCGVVSQACAGCGWRNRGDISYQSALDWFVAKRAAGEWMGTTWNRNATALRGFTRWLRKTKRITTDPLEDFDRAEDDGGAGSRAATTEEVRAMLEHAYVRQLSDGRCKGARDIVEAATALMALRAGEPEQLLWRHMHLDEPVPYFAWKKAFNKAKRDEDLALAPELVPLLLAHRERMRELAKRQPVIVRRNHRTGAKTERYVDPDDPRAFVFPQVPSRTTIRADRDAAGVQAVDRFGQRVSPHSLRKWLDTTLTNAGVPFKMVAKLMRHRGGVEGRYYTPTLAEQAAALSVLPRIYPQFDKGSDNDPWFEKCESELKKPLVDRRESGYLSDASPKDNRAVLESPHNSTQPPRVAGASTAPLGSQISQVSSTPRRGSAELSGASGRSSGVQSSVGFDPGMPSTGLDTGPRSEPDPADLATVGEAMLIMLERRRREGQHGR